MCRCEGELTSCLLKRAEPTPKGGGSATKTAGTPSLRTGACVGTRRCVGGVWLLVTGSWRRCEAACDAPRPRASPPGLRLEGAAVGGSAGVEISSCANGSSKWGPLALRHRSQHAPPREEEEAGEAKGCHAVLAALRSCWRSVLAASRRACARLGGLVYEYLRAPVGAAAIPPVERAQRHQPKDPLRVAPCCSTRALPSPKAPGCSCRARSPPRPAAAAHAEERSTPASTMASMLYQHLPHVVGEASADPRKPDTLREHRSTQQRWQLDQRGARAAGGDRSPARGLNCAWARGKSFSRADGVQPFARAGPERRLAAARVDCSSTTTTACTSWRHRTHPVRT